MIFILLKIVLNTIDSLVWIHLTYELIIDLHKTWTKVMNIFCSRELNFKAYMYFVYISKDYVKWFL